MNPKSKITILNIDENKLLLRVDSLNLTLESDLNEDLLGDISKFKTTILSFINDLAVHFAEIICKTVTSRFEEVVIKIANYHISDYATFEKHEYSPNQSNLIIEKIDVIDWVSDISQEFEDQRDEMLMNLPSEEMYKFMEMYFIVDITFSHIDWLQGLEIGMTMNSNLDTWI